MPAPTIWALIFLTGAAVAERYRLITPFWKHIAARLLIRVCYPALILSTLPLRIQVADLRILWPLPFATALLLLLGRFVGRRLLPWVALSDAAKERIFVFTALLPNYSYVPLLITQALWGEQAMALVVLSSAGADLILWTLAVHELSGESRLSWRRLVNPPLISLILSLILLMPFAAPWLLSVKPYLGALKGIGGTAIPLSMFLLGSQLGRRREKAAPHDPDRKGQIALLLWHLLGSPACMFAFLLLVPLPQLAALVLLTVASMPGAIVAVVLATQYDAHPAFAARHVFVGHVVGIASTSFWIVLGTRVF